MKEKQATMQQEKPDAKSPTAKFKSTKATKQAAHKTALGIGTSVLEHVMAACGDHRPYRLNVFQARPARRLYERHGFTHDHEDTVDVFLIAHVTHPATRTHGIAS